MNFIKARVRNYAFWVSLVSFIGLLVNMKYPAFGGKYSDISNAFLTLIVAAGIVNNPTTLKRGFGDD